MGLACFGALFGSLAKIDTSLSASGKLRPIGGIREVASPFPAPIAQVRVREGQQVKAGEILAELDVEEWQREQKTLRALLNLWRKDASQAARQLGLPAIGQPGAEELSSLSVDLREINLRRRAADQRRLRSKAGLRQQVEQLDVLRRKYAINANIRDRMARLLNQGAISQLELERHDERQMELFGAILKAEQELVAARRSLAESEANLEQVTTSNSQSLWDRYDAARKQILETSSRLSQVDERLQRSRLVAPISGKVFDLTAKSGEIASVGKPLVKIVPLQSLEAELAISNRDIGFLKPGLPVEVRVTSFPFTDYGSLKGTILRVGDDAMPADQRHPQDYFPAIARIERNTLERQGQGGTYQLRSGMEVSALIQTGSRPALALLNDRLASFVESARSIR
jgi:HlyD family secretion protein